MMARRALAAAAVLALGALAVPGPASSAVPLPLDRVVAGPGAALTGYLTPDLEVAKGATLEFVNLDAVSHDVTSRAKGKDGKPLFKSKFTGAGAVPVVGVEKLAPGVYAYFCTPHVAMIGTVTVT